MRIIYVDFFVFQQKLVLSAEEKLHGNMLNMQINMKTGYMTLLTYMTLSIYWYQIGQKNVMVYLGNVISFWKELNCDDIWLKLTMRYVQSNCTKTKWNEWTKNDFRRITQYFLGWHIAADRCVYKIENRILIYHNIRFSPSTVIAVKKLFLYKANLVYLQSV